MASPYFTAEHEEFRARTRTFLRAYALPELPAWDEAGGVPASAWRELGRRGLLGLMHGSVAGTPASGGAAGEGESGGEGGGAGGGGGDLFTSIAFLEELGALGYAGFRAAVSVHAYMATHYLGAAADPYLTERYLRPAVRGELVASLALTEPAAGSDMSALATTAVRDGDHYVVDGTKSMVTNARSGGFMVTAVRTGKAARPGTPAGISLLVVDLTAPGVRITPTALTGWHSAGVGEVALTGVRVPAAHLVGRENGGFYALMRGLQLERIAAAALAVGGADHCLRITREFLRSRRLFDRSAASFQAVRHRFADLTTDLAAARALVHHAAWTYLQDPMAVATCSMAKLHATELACRVADSCLQLHGSHGYLAGSDIARVHREARAATMAAGPSETMRDIIARTALDEPG